MCHALTHTHTRTHTLTHAHTHTHTLTHRRTHAGTEIANDDKVLGNVHKKLQEFKFGLEEWHPFANSVPGVTVKKGEVTENGKEYVNPGAEALLSVNPSNGQVEAVVTANGRILGECFCQTMLL